MAKLTPGRVLTALHMGAVLVVEHVVEGRKAKKTYRLSTTGALVKTNIVLGLIENGLIKGNNDGLPGIGESQTYSIRRSSDPA